ncbi:CHAP domain-containing protein [Micavibrio aeruginosavorus]|uniref:CHAP domain-containing protein n=1 Tax=Micavibrio aeruginosavorus TaxID=349221 RepID=UPI003F4ABC6E
MKKLLLPVAALLLLSACTTTRSAPPAAKWSYMDATPRPESVAQPAPAPVPMATYSMMRKAEQCVPYARRVSGIELFGDAHSWWNQAAAKNYPRGQRPMPGSVLVLPRTSKMKHGHVAVVKDVLDSRNINVTHTNWGNTRETRRAIYHSMRVQDISTNNDWSRVRFWNAHDDVFGFPYAANGFIYRQNYASFTQ